MQPISNTNTFTASGLAVPPERLTGLSICLARSCFLQDSGGDKKRRHNADHGLDRKHVERPNYDCRYPELFSVHRGPLASYESDVGGVNNENHVHETSN